MLRSGDGDVRLEVEEVEPQTRGERLELLSVVRGLEALEQPSHVVLMTPSVYVREGIRHGLAEWRRNGWRWERFGEMVPVKHLDLWQRVERALRFHKVDCRTIRFDPVHGGVRGPSHMMQNEQASPSPCAVPRGIQYRLAQFARGIGDRFIALTRRAGQRMAEWWSVRGVSAHLARS